MDIQQVVNHKDQIILQCFTTQINMSEFPSSFESPMMLVESLLVIRFVFHTPAGNGKVLKRCPEIYLSHLFLLAILVNQLPNISFH